MKQSVYSRKTKAFGMSTKWLFFYIFIRFPLSFLLSVISIFDTYVPCIPYLFGGYLDPVFYVAMIVDFAYFAVSIITFVKLLKLSPSSLKWNKVYLWFGVFHEFLVMLIVQDFSYYMVGRLTGAFSWAWANLSYFNRRSELFELEVPPEAPAYTPNYDYVQQPVAPAQNGGFSDCVANSVPAYHQPYPGASPSPQTPVCTAPLCPKCGNALIAGAKFCNRCGTQVEENTHEM